MATIVLNNPIDTEVVTVDKPEFKFTGSDINGDDITYQIQVDTANTFDSQSSLIDNYPVSNYNGNKGSFANNLLVGQSFTGNGSSITKVVGYIENSSGATGDMICHIYAHTGVYGSTGKPIGSPLASSDTVSASTAGSTMSLIDFNFSTPFLTTSGTHYCIAFQTIGGNNNSIRIGGNSSSTTHPGNRFVTPNNGAAWFAQSIIDLIFYVYSGGALIDKKSNADVGFLNLINGADTDPFTTDNEISYTVQTGSELADATTYYWRVRGKDPGGTNTYGSWSTTRTFSVDLSTPMRLIMS